MPKYYFPDTNISLNELIFKWKNILNEDDLEQNAIDFYKTNIREGLELKKLFDNFETLVTDKALSIVVDNKTKKFYIMNVNTAECIWLSYKLTRQILLNYGYECRGLKQVKEKIQLFLDREAYKKMDEMYDLIKEKHPRREVELTFTQLDVCLAWKCENENKNTKSAN